MQTVHVKPIRHGLLLSAVLTAMAVLPAWANTAGIDAILEAAAGNKPIHHAPVVTHPHATRIPTVPAPAVRTPPVSIPAPSKAKVTSFPAAKKVVPKPAVSPHKIPSDMLVGPVPHKVTPMAVEAHPTAVPTQQHGVTPTRTSTKSPAVEKAKTAHAVSGLAPTHFVAPANAAVKAQTAAVTAGYINPFMGTPSKVQKLSGTLNVLKLQTKIAKARAAYAKYDSEANSLTVDNSPQLRELEQTVESLREQMQALKASDVHAQAMTQEAHAQSKKAKHKLKVIAIIRDQGQRNAIIQDGKSVHTVAAGDSVNGHLIQGIDAHQVILADGQTLPLSQQIGHYDATSWKGNQSNGNIASPQQSGILDKLAAEAKQNGIRFSGPGEAPKNGLPPLNPGMLQHP